MIGIYKIQNLINNKSYIGKSVSIEDRWNKHKSNCFNKNSKSYDFAIYRAMRKYGSENFSFEILEKFDKIDQQFLGEREQYWIKQFDSFYNGYNMTLGGDGRPILEIELDEFVEIYNQTKSLSKTASILGCSVDTVKSRLKIAEVEILEYGNTQIQGSRVPLKGIIQFNKNQEKIQEFNSVFEAAKFIQEEKKLQTSLKAIGGALSKCATGKTKSSYGYIWKYKEEQNFLNFSEKPSRQTLKEEIRFKTFSELARKYQVSVSTICKWCSLYNLPSTKREIKTYSDLEWVNI